MTEYNDSELYTIKTDGLDNYKITPTGKVWSTKTKKFLATRGVNGYQTLKIHNTEYAIHRLVTLTFVPNTDNKPYVNHIDENKANNYYKNLEWVSQKENTERHSKTISHSRQVMCIDKTTNETIKTYEQVTKAAEDVNISRRAIQLVLNGDNQTAGGYKWKYVDSSNNKDTVDINTGKKIYDYDNYYVFENGNIYNKNTKKLVKPVKNAAGRCYVTLCKDRKKQNVYVNRVVADHYLPDKPNDKSVVEHIDGNATNNTLSNLRWGKGIQPNIKL